MPSESQAQHNLMEAVEHEPGLAAKKGIPKKVARHYIEADKAEHGKAMAAALRKMPIHKKSEPEEGY